MIWKDFLKDAERQRLEELEAQGAEARRERRLIYDRCYKRAKVAEKVGQHSTAEANGQ